MTQTSAISTLFGFGGDRGRAADLAQLGVIHQIQAQRTPQLDAVAIALDQSGRLSLWTGEAKAYRTAVGGGLSGWAGTALVGAAMGITALATSMEKLVSRHVRPFQLDPTVTQLGPRPLGSSDPSGHASASYAAATVLGALEPDQAARLDTEADDVAAARVYSGDHFPSDVVAGAQLGSTIAGDLLRLLHVRHPVPPYVAPDTSVDGVLGALTKATGAEPTEP